MRIIFRVIKKIICQFYFSFANIISEFIPVFGLSKKDKEIIF